MPLLSFGSSGNWCSVGLLWPVRTPVRVADRHSPTPAWTVQSACVSEQAGHGHAERLLPMADSVLAQAGLSLSDIALIGLDAGPGGFTSLRIGCGLAQGLALGIGCPIVTVSSLSALAWPHRAVRCLTATDARMGEVYLAAWPPMAGPELVSAAQIGVGPPAQLAALIPVVAQAHRLDLETAGNVSEMPWVATGDAFTRYPDLAELAQSCGAIVLADAFPRGDVIARIAAAAWARGESVPPDEAAPLYVRNKVALNVDEQRALRQARDGGR